MVVEDEWIVADVIQKSLINLGYTVTSVEESGEKVVQRVEEVKPDLILMDIVLKGNIDGIEAAGQIQAHFNIPIVYLTAYDDKTSMERAKITEPFGYLIKPFKERELYTTIEMALYKHKAEEQIRTSLKEKEVLLKEIHHRVKNNMNIIISLIRLQSKDIKDELYLDKFKECENRINAMSLIHEELYRSRKLANIDFSEYLESMACRILETYEVHAEKISLSINVDKVFLGVNKAIPCGLIINEFLTNTVKYAFPGDKRGEIKISMRLIEGKIELIVRDNGIGIPKDLDFENTNTLGMELVNVLTQQLKGTVELDRSKGTEFKIIFEE